MARIYSWQLTDTKYAYITGINNDEPFVGNRLKTEDYEIVTDKVDSMSAAQYSANFDKLCVLCNQYGLDPTKEGEVSAMAFYDTTNLNSNFMVVLVGKDGKDGARGEKGEKGDPGEPGVTPDTPIPYISVTAYCSTGNRDIRPDTPKEGDITIKWNPNTKQYTFEDSKGEWYLYDSEANENDGDGSDKSIIWQSSAVYNDKGIVSPWTKPIRITGENGEPGTDGNNLEFIYQRRTHQWVNPERPTSKNENKYVPLDEGWTGSPTGIDDVYRYEYMCQRRKDKNDNWSEWEGPMIWSRWGDDGKDGDAVEYAYFTTNGTEPKVRYDVEISSEEYQKTEYRPYVQMPNSNGTYVDVKDNEGNLVRWYDNPRQIDAEDNRAQWVIIRKRRVNEGSSKATWGEFSDPALWSMYGEKGDPGVEGLNVYERRMYCSHDVNNAPEVGKPTEFDPGFPWAPAVPKEKGSNQGIWAIEAYIKLISYKKQDGTTEYEQVLCWYDGSTEERTIDETTGEKGVPRWSVPYIIEGRDGADFVHSREEIFKCVALGDNGEKIPPPPPTQNDTEKDNFVPSSEGWSQYMEGLSDETPLCYMCYRERTYDEWWGTWSEWKGPYIYTQLGTQGPPGTDGTDGKDGTNVEYVYTRTFDGNPPMCYVPANDYDIGEFQKPDYFPYTSADMNLKWHDEPRGVDEGTPYEWVASRTRKYNEVSEVVEWSEFSEPGIFAKYGFNGKDGKDIEYVYALTKTYDKPQVKDYDNNSTVAQSPEFYPEIVWNGEAGGVSGNTVSGITYWMDNAKDVTIDWPYQWEIIRKRIGTPKPDNSNLFDYEWEKYTDANVTLHSKWGRDGDQGRQGVAGVAGIHYEMRFIQARQDENDNIYLYVPEIKNNNFTGKFIEVHYVDDNNVEQDAWKNYWYNTKHPDIDGEDVKFLYQTRSLNRTYFPLYTDTLAAKDYPYMFFIQSRITVERTEIKETNPNNKQEEIVRVDEIEVLEKGQWEAPARLTGQQGIQGPEGKRGPMLYSAGVYGVGKKYYTDGNKKPYVLDPADKEYYYLEKGNRTDDTGNYWYIEMDGNDDTKDNLPCNDAIKENYHWVKMEQFDVILANVGIFNSALVGSGVFYGEWFYSQNGLSGNTIVSNYEEFDPNTKINKGPSISWGSENNFKPSLAMNLKDGSGWFANQNIIWDSWGNMNCSVNGSFNGNGSGELAGGAITWDNDGLYIHKDTTFDADVELKWGNISDRNTVENAIKAAKDAADAADTRMDNWVADGYISKLELQGIKDEKAFIVADKNDIDKKCTKYSIADTNATRTEYTTAYTNYYDSLNSIVNSLTGTTERVAAGNLATNQGTYYSNRTAILEAIVTAEQTYVSTAASAATQAAKDYSDGNTEVLKQYAREYANGIVPTDEYITTITKNAITTDWLNARNITAGGITAAGLSAHTATIGTIAAENMDVDNLYVKKLNTKGKGQYTSGTISIEENEINVYNKTKATEVVRITGTELKEIPVVITGTTSSASCFSYNLFNDLSNKSSRIYGSKSIGNTSSLKPDDGYKYSVTNFSDENPSSVAVTFTIKAETTNFTTAQQVTLKFSAGISNKQENYSGSTTSLKLFEGYSSGYTGTEQSWSKTVTVYLNSTPQSQYVNWSFESLSTGSNSLSNVTIKGTISSASYRLVPDINICDISPLGFRYIVNHKKYVVFKKDGTFFLRSGDNGIGVNDDGCFITTDGKTLQKITVSPEKEFRCVGNNIKGKVLMVGNYDATLPAT